MRVPRKMLGALGVGVLVAGTWFTAPTLAQSDDGETDETTREERRAEIEERRAEHKAEFLEAVAEELGIDAGDLEAAIDTVRERFRAERQEECEARRDDVRAGIVERLRERVDSGDLTEEEAREMLARFDERDCEDGPRHRRGHRGFGPRFRGGSDTAPDSGPDSENAAVDLI